MQPIVVLNYHLLHFFSCVQNFLKISRILLCLLFIIYVQINRIGSDFMFQIQGQQYLMQLIKMLIE